MYVIIYYNIACIYVIQSLFCCVLVTNQQPKPADQADRGGHDRE